MDAQRGADGISVFAVFKLILLRKYLYPLFKATADDRDTEPERNVIYIDRCGTQTPAVAFRSAFRRCSCSIIGCGNGTTRSSKFFGLNFQTGLAVTRARLFR
jgi:hypothetical protein